MSVKPIAAMLIATHSMATFSSQVAMLMKNSLSTCPTM